jgi:ABC-type uncharacterized transport system permease subunit
VSQITILLLYLLAAAGFAMSRLPRFTALSRPSLYAAGLLVSLGIVLHGTLLFELVLPGSGFSFSIGNAASMIGLELALIALLAAFEPTLRGMSAGLLLLSASTVLLTGGSVDPASAEAMPWQVRGHILLALLSYGFLSVGAIVAVYSLLQERRLRSAKITAVNQLFAPLETTEKLLVGVAAAGFAGLTLAIASGATFVNNLLEQHLAHKFGLSLIAWIIFGILLGGRFFAGWRGKRIVKLYLWGFAILGLAYFGSRLILQEIFEQSWH